MNAVKKLTPALCALLAISFVPMASADIEFDCHYDVSPLNYGANPTIFSRFRVTSPELGDFFKATSVTLTNTATHSGTTVGPMTMTANKTLPPQGPVWIVNNTFAWPPYSAVWSMSGRAEWTNIACFGSNCIPLVEQDLCTIQETVHAPSGGGGGGGGGGSCAIIDPVTSALSIDGEVQTLPDAGPNAPLTATRTATDGRRIVSDEVGVRSDGAYPVQDGARANSGKGAPALYVRHQATHANNGRYAPTPRVRLLTQRLANSGGLHGLQGFAIVELGASGRVVRVQATSGSGGAAPDVIRHAIASGVRSELRMRGVTITQLISRIECPVRPCAQSEQHS